MIGACRGGEIAVGHGDFEPEPAEPLFEHSYLAEEKTFGTALLRAGRVGAGAKISRLPD